MRDRTIRAGPQRRLDLASARTGRDWARWLDQAMPAQPFGTQWPASAQLTVARTALAQLARHAGVTAGRCGCADGDAVTTWAERRIHLRRPASREALIAPADQLGHVLPHAENAYLGRPGSFACRGIRDAEATSVAYLAAAHLDVTSTAITFPHPSRWAGSGPPGHPAPTIQAGADRVIAAAANITRRLDAAVAAEPGPPRQPHGPRAGDPGHIPASGGPVAPGQPSPGGVRCGQADGARRNPRGRASGLRPGQQRPGAAAGPGPPPSRRGPLVRAHHAAARFFRTQLPGSWVPGYLTSRGFDPATQAGWQAGYAPAAWDALTRHLRRLGYPAAVIEAAGLARRSRRGTLIDTFRDRAVLPIRGTDGAIAGFIGRARDGAGPQVPKYLNSPATALYRKRAALFGLWQARRLLARGARPVLTEGPLDAIAVTAAGAGRFAGVAPCGTALTPEQAAALGRFADLAATGVVVAFDADQAGRKAAVAAYHLLTEVTAELTAADLPAGRDPAEILAEYGAAALASALARARPLADLVIDAEVDGWSRWLRYAEGQFNALRGAAAQIAAMPPGQIARQVARLAHRLGLGYATVTEAVTEAVADALSPASAASDSGKRRRPK